MSQSRPSRKPELDHMNAVACLCVILIHVLSLGISTMDLRTPAGALVYFPWRLAAYVVPMFLFTGAVKLSAQFGGRRITPADYGRYCLQRIRKIYLPYVGWNVVYFVVFWLLGYQVLDVSLLPEHILWGTLSAPFYYVVVVMQFYLLMPVWIWMVRRLPFYISVCGAILIQFVAEQLPGLLPSSMIAQNYMDRVFPSYLVFWIIGLYVGANYQSLSGTFAVTPARVAAGLGIVAFSCGISYYQSITGQYIFNLYHVKPVGDVVTILLLLSICRTLNGRIPHLKNPFAFLYRSSFFVYLSHCLFLTIGDYWMSQWGISSLYIRLVLRAAVCYTCPFLLYALWSAIKRKPGGHQ